MKWDESDSDLEKEYNKLAEKEIILRNKLQEIRKLQNYIESIRLRQTEKIKDNKRIIVFEKPLDTTGETMTDADRQKYKTKLITKLKLYSKN